jgi:hypothetical protein
MSKTLAIIGRWLLFIVLSAASAWSGLLTIRFMARVMPAEEWGQFYWLPGVAAVVVFSVGTYAWAFAYVYGEGRLRRALALVMALVCFLSDLSLTIGELWLGGQSIAAVPAWAGNTALMALSIGVSAVIGGGALYFLTDPQSEHAARVQDAKDSVTTAALNALTVQAEVLAAQAAPQLAAEQIAAIKREFGIVDNDEGVRWIAPRAGDEAQHPVIIPPTVTSANPTKPLTGQTVTMETVTTPGAARRNGTK